MATEIQIIEKVRRRISDYLEDRRYDDGFYLDAIDNSLQKLNFDFGEAYLVVPDVPTNRVFLLTKLVTIDMCWVRASESAEGGSSVESTSSRWTEIEVPNLRVEDKNHPSARGATYWLALAQKLQQEYDEEVGSKAGTNSGAEVDVGVSRRISLTNGGYRKRKLDPGLSAVTVLATVDGNDVLLEWSKLQVEDFLYYEIVRSSTSTFASETVLRQEDDIHVTEYVDESVASGTWYYRVKSVNPNVIKTNSTTVSVTVV